MALPVHRGPLRIIPAILLSLHQTSTSTAAPHSPHPNIHIGGIGGFKLITFILVGVVIVVLFFLGFFTAYLRRCLRNRNRNTSSQAAVLAAVTAAAIATPPNRQRRGLDRTTIDSFPSIPFSRVQCIKPTKLRYGPECAICLGGFSDEEMLRLLPGCRHVFHVECIDRWLSSHITCPVCRADLSDPIVAAAGESLMEDLADERCSDAVEIVVEMFHVDPDPDLDPDPQLHPVTVQPYNARQDLDLAKRYQRAASLVSFHGRKSAPLESLVRNLSSQWQIQADSDLGERSSMPILQGTPRHSDPGKDPVSCPYMVCIDMIAVDLRQAVRPGGLDGRWDPLAVTRKEIMHITLVLRDLSYMVTWRPMIGYRRSFRFQLQCNQHLQTEAIFLL